jgi:hypothetical protein
VLIPKGVKVLCFDTLLQVLIPKKLGRGSWSGKWRSRKIDVVTSGARKATCGVELTRNVTTRVSSLSRKFCKLLKGKRLR